MEDIYDQTRGIISNFLKKDSFSVLELEKSINESGAPMRVAPAYTVKDYLFELQNDGIIKFQPSSNNFKKVDSVQSSFLFLDHLVKC